VKRLRSTLCGLAYVGPLCVAITAVVIGPAIFGMSRAFVNWQPGGSSPFVGLANFRLLIDSPAFREVLVNEGIFLLGVPIWTILPLVLAVFLFQRVRFAGLIRTLIFLPAVVSPALLGVMFTPILAPNGLVNNTLGSLGMSGLARPWIDNPDLVKPTIIVLLAWANVGLGVAVFTAALTGIQPVLLDAAEVAGASSWQKITNVILPGLRRTVVGWATFQALQVFLWIFGWIFALTGGGPGNSSTSMDYDIYNNTIVNGLYGLGAAEAVYLLMMVILVAVIGWGLGKRWSSD
jgi:multiple sugar transport system permease protein